MEGESKSTCQPFDSAHIVPQQIQHRGISTSFLSSCQAWVQEHFQQWGEEPLQSLLALKGSNTKRKKVQKSWHLLPNSCTEDRTSHSDALKWFQVIFCF